MKRIVMAMLLLAAVCVNVFADNDRCGLRMSVNGYEGTEMLGCYEYVHLKVSNPTDTIAYIPENGGLKVFRVYFDGNGETAYDVVGTYNEEISLAPGEKKDIRVKTSLCTYDGTYFGYVGRSKSDKSTVYALDEYFTDVEFYAGAYRNWDVTAYVAVEGLAKRHQQDVVYGDNVTVTVTLRNNEDELYTPEGYTLLLKEYGSSNVIAEYSMGDVYLLPDEEFTRTITFDNVDTEKRYVVELRHLNRYVSNSDIASSKDFTLLSSDDLGITVEHVGFEGTVMRGCVPFAIFNVHNSQDKPVSLMKYMDWDGLCVYRVIEREDGTEWYSQLGYMPDEDFILEAGETKEVKFRVPMVKAGILHCCVGSFNYDNSDIPFEIFSYFDIDIAESRPWDFTAEINVRGLEEVDGRKVLADTNATVDIVITNNEDELYTPYQPILSLYKMSNNTAVRYKAYNTGAHYFEPYAPETFTIHTSDVLKEQGVYFFAVETNNLLSTIGRSETFTVDTTLDIDNVSIASESSVEVYTLDGKLVATGDTDNVIDGLDKGLYIIKDNQGTRKVMK